MLRRLRQDGGGWPAHCRSTPELDQVRAQVSALMPYRVAAGVLELLLPIDAGSDPETLRACTLKVGAICGTPLRLNRRPQPRRSP